MKVANFLKSSLKLSLCFGLSSFVYAERGDSFDAAVKRCEEMSGGQILKNPVWVTCQQDLEYWKKLEGGRLPFDLGTKLSNIHVKMKGDKTPSISSDIAASSDAECNVHAKIEASLTGTARYTCDDILALRDQMKGASQDQNQGQQQQCQGNQQQDACYVYENAGAVEDKLCSEVLEGAHRKHQIKTDAHEDLRLALGHADAQDDEVAQQQQQQRREMAAVVYRDSKVRAGCEVAPTQKGKQKPKGSTVVVSITSSSDSSSSDHAQVKEVSEKEVTDTSSNSSSSVAAVPAPAKQGQQGQGKVGGKGNPLAGEDRYLISDTSSPSDSDYAVITRDIFGGAQFAEEAHQIGGDSLAHKRHGIKVTKEPHPGSVLFNAGVRKGDFILYYFNDHTMHRVKSVKWFLKRHQSKSNQQVKNFESNKPKTTRWEYHFYKAQRDEQGVTTLNEAGQTQPAGEIQKGKVVLGNGIGESIAES